MTKTIKQPVIVESMNITLRPNKEESTEELGHWSRFVRTISQLIGSPDDLVRRFAEAKLSQEEAKAEHKLAEALLISANADLVSSQADAADAVRMIESLKVRRIEALANFASMVEELEAKGLKITVTGNEKDDMIVLVGRDAEEFPDMLDQLTKETQ